MVIPIIKVDDLVKLMEITALTGFVKNEKPTSLFLIAEAESGKSEMIKILAQYPNTFYTNDLSFQPLVEQVLPFIERGESSHIIIPDFINVISHKKSAENVIPILNSLMEEGLKDLKYYGALREYKTALNCGLVTGVTKRYFDKHILMWRAIGFLSRMIPITYKHSHSTQIAVNNFIREEKDKKLDKISFNGAKRVKVEIPKDLGVQLQTYAEMITTQNQTYISQVEHRTRKIDLKSYGYRMHRMMRALLKATALYNSKGKRKIANDLDLRTLVGCFKFVNFNFTEV